MSGITMVQAINLALARAMTEDSRVVVLGEDVGRDGGVFRATEGLIDRFGAARVRDTPLAEAGIVGVAVGIAAAGLIPVAEIQFSGFVYPAIDQIINHAARLRTRTRGRLTCPLVVRMPAGGGIRAVEHHSECPEAMFAHIPGLRVVVPSTPRDAYGLLLAAIRDPDPVIFFEPTRLYRLAKEEVADDGSAAPLDRAVLRREGGDVTIIAWGGMVTEALDAADLLAGAGIAATIVDLPTLKPLDEPAILAAVARTGRCVIVQEAPLSGGVGAEIAARIAERGLLSLVAPIERVAAPDVVVPLPRLEAQYRPGAARIVAAARRACAFA